MNVGLLLVITAIGSACVIPYWLSKKWNRAWFIPLGAFIGMASSFAIVILVHYLTQIGKNSGFPPLESPGLLMLVLKCVIFTPPVAALAGWWKVRVVLAASARNE